MVKLTVLTTIRGLDEVIARYCYGCRNDNAKASGVASSNLNPESAGERRKAGTRSPQDACPVMPPYGLPRPAKRTYDGPSDLLDLRAIAPRRPRCIWVMVSRSCARRGT